MRKGGAMLMVIEGGRGRNGYYIRAQVDSGEQ